MSQIKTGKSSPADESARRIVEAICALQPGSFSSYGGIAAAAGLPGRARLVARVLGTLPRGTEVPWHRVLGAGGRIAMPPDSRGAREQRRRLLAEGVIFKGARAVAPETDLDAVLWKPRPSTKSRSTRRNMAS